MAYRSYVPQRDIRNACMYFPLVQTLYPAGFSFHLDEVKLFTIRVEKSSRLVMIKKK